MTYKINIAALTKEFGPVGMACFIRWFDRGEGDYTHERQGDLAYMTLEDIERQMET